MASRDEGLLLGDAARAIRRQPGHAAPLGSRRQAAHHAATRANRRRVPRRRSSACPTHPSRHRAGDRSRRATASPGVVRSVEIDGVMALVEIEAVPHRVTAAITRDAVEELGLAPGVPATAAVKATSVMVERVRREPALRCHSRVALALVAVAAATTTHDGSRGSKPHARRLGRLLHDRGAHLVQPRLRRTRR